MEVERESDWNAKVIEFSDLAEDIGKHAASIYRAVVLAKNDDDAATIAELVATTPMHSVSVVTRNVKSTTIVPGAIKAKIYFQKVEIKHSLKGGGEADGEQFHQPRLVKQTKGECKSPTIRDTELLRVVIPQETVEHMGDWSTVTKEPRKFVFKMLKEELPTEIAKAIVDTWGYAQERDEGQPTITGLVKVHKSAVKLMLSYSGIANLIFEPLRWQDPLPRVQVKWIDKNKDETGAAYRKRRIDMRPAYGLARGRKQLGLRATYDPTENVMHTWYVDHVPRTWDDTALLECIEQQTELVEVSIKKPKPRGSNHSAYWLLAKSPPTIDTTPMYFQDDEGSWATCWLRHARPTQAKEREKRPIKDDSRMRPPETGKFGMVTKHVIKRDDDRRRQRRRHRLSQLLRQRQRRKLQRNKKIEETGMNQSTWILTTRSP